jgi:CRISPR/Cas system CSM-associated protein Csm3 (group 7 of RAMP superfamily)
MENATITKNGKGWLLSFENGKSMPLNWTNLPETLMGKAAQVKREKGQPVEIIVEGISYKKPAPFDAGQNQGSGQYDRNKDRNPQSNYRGHESERDPARAPYNFVPLNKLVVSGNGETDHSRYMQLSGFLDLRIEAKNPLFVRGYDGNFFRVNDKPYLPGSSIRGLAHSMMEVVSYGKLNYFENKQLYRRSNLTEDGNQVFGGFLKIEDGAYLISPARYSQERRSDFRDPHTYQFSSNTNNCTFSTGKFANRITVWRFTKNDEGNISAGLNKVLLSYKSDDTRAEQAIDLLNSLRRGRIVDKNGHNIGQGTAMPTNMGIPVFYRIDSSGKIISIGHAKYHRVPYSHSIGDHISQNGEITDFPTLLFGTDKIAGKVFFEDFAPMGVIHNDLKDAQCPKILSSPKPTTYQHYLNQPNRNKASKTWSDEDASIRGWKNYWHKKTSSKENDPNTWIETGKPTKSHPNPINPISVGSTFHGRIRFENLSKEELGALLFVLDLPEGCAHKLGMGKSLGLGSVRITTTLTLINRQARYTEVFEENGNWFTGENPVTDLNSYKDAFAKYVGEQTKQLGVTDAASYWLNDTRMKELNHMLTFDNNLGGVSWEDRTRYMEIEHPEYNNEYKNRPVLPKPSEVVQKDTYKRS